MVFRSGTTCRCSRCCSGGTPDEVLTVAITLAGRTAPATRQMVVDLIESFTHQTALGSDIARVTAHLGDPDHPPDDPNSEGRKARNPA
jgi:hypothetical protein